MGTILSGAAASEQIDSSGEILVVKGADISSFLEGKGILNYEHKGPQDAGASANDKVGAIVYAKKIYKASDCEDEDQRKHWKLVNEVPYIYIRGELFDDEDHPGAKALAAAIRYYAKRKEQMHIGFSIEGSTVTREGNLLKESVAREVAITFRPCNQSAYLNVYKPDSKAKPKTLLEELSEDTKKFEPNGNVRLGGASYDTYFEDPVSPFDAVRKSLADAVQAMHKAYPDAYAKTVADLAMPPLAKTLTSGSGLQVEHIRDNKNGESINHLKKLATAKGVLGIVKTAIRDGWSLEKVQSVLKAEMPEVSDAFLDIFNPDNQPITLKQKDAFLAKAEPTDKQKGKAKEYKKTLKRLDRKGAVPPPIESEPKPAKRKVKKGGTYFDEENGVLYSPSGAFRMHIPQGQDYKEIFNHPALQKVHDAALKNWATMHRLFRSGKMPGEVVAHAAMFSAMSPNTAVPVQELAYAHLQDLTQKGFKPGVYDPQAISKYGPEWDAIAKGQRLPAFMGQHFQDPDSGIWTPEGKRYKIGLHKQKLQGAASYPAMHSAIMDMLSQGKTASQISAELNAMKASNAQFSGEDGKSQKIGQGFAPKTIRYLLGMAGGGDVTVPDTHFIRHAFGLHQTDPRNGKLKNILWDSRNEPALQSMDRYYYNHHPAVQYTRDRLKELTGEDFGQQATFPSFWAHWLSVMPHEKMRGWYNKGNGTNEGTDHAVFYNSVANILQRHGIPFQPSLLKAEDGPSMPNRTAHAQAEIANKWGDEAADLAYYAFMAPALLANAHHLVKSQTALEKLQVLAKATRPFTPGTPPQIAPVDVDKYGLHPYNPAQRAMVHGLDVGEANASGVNPVEALGSGGLDVIQNMRHSDSTDRFMDGKAGFEPGVRRNGALFMFLKPGSQDNNDYRSLGDLDKFSSAQREAAFHMLADNFFGLGEHVPVTAAFRHPHTGEHISAQKLVTNGTHEHDDATNQYLGDTGVLDKLAVMDVVLHNSDRHPGNYLTSKEAPYLHLIDNGYAFTGNPMKSPGRPYYLDRYMWRNFNNPQLNPNAMQFHPAAIAWLNGLTPQKLQEQMHYMGLPPGMGFEAARRLDEIKKGIAQGLGKDALFAPFSNGQQPSKMHRISSTPFSVHDTDRTQFPVGVTNG